MATIPTQGPAGAANLGDNARIVLERRYLARDGEGNLVETPDDLFRRVASNIAEAERLYLSEDMLPESAEAEVSEWRERFLDLISSLRFLPNSPTLGNAGRPLQQLA